MPTMPTQYYNRFDSDKNYESHLFIAGRGLQSAELNEIQSQSASRLKSVADAMFADGDIIRDCQCFVDSVTGAVTMEAGAIYVKGAVRGVPPATFTIPVVGVVTIGIRLVSTVITFLTDPELLDPATGTRNYGNQGAERLKVEALWGWDGDGQAGEFFPVYTVEDGLLRPKEAPPSLDAFNQALARYDRDSAGGMYVVSGLSLQKLADQPDGKQVYSLAEGRARVYGYGIEFATSRRLLFNAIPDLKLIANEPHLSSTASAQRINLDRTPATLITEVSITAEKTVTLTHGVFTGAQDVLPDTSVLSLVEVKQGATTYVANTDYLLTAGKVDWSPAGNEPAPGSTYTVKYHYITNVTPTNVDDKGFTVTGALSGTLVLVTYSQKMPRIDRLCLNTEGAHVWLIGVSADYYPQPPQVPSDLLLLASVYQSWDSNRYVVNDGVRVVTMPTLAGIESRFDRLLQLVAQNRLESDIHTREAGTKKGLFTDPFIDNSQRDAGMPQSAAIVRGELILPIAGEAYDLDQDIEGPVTIGYLLNTILEQPFRTGEMQINPYMAFAPVPATIELSPAVDRWTEVITDWPDSTTSRFVNFRPIAARAGTTQTSVAVMLGRTSTNLETMRQIEVEFTISGFGAGEILNSFTFDGIEIVPTAI